MLHYKHFLPVLVLAFAALSCEKTLDDHVSGTDGSQISQTLDEPVNLRSYSQDNGAVMALRAMFENHFKYHATLQPWDYLPDAIKATFKSTYTSESATMDAVGYDSYLTQKTTAGTLSSGFAASLRQIHSTINNLNDGNLGDLAGTLERQRSQLTLVSYDQHSAQLVYDVILTAFHELYPEGGATQRDALCKIKDLLNDILKGVEVGASVGQIVGAIFEYDGNSGTPTSVAITIGSETIKLSMQTLGAIIGGIVGGVVGIFNGDPCDCGPPMGISVVNAGNVNCNPAGFQLYAWGAGDDAEFFNWIVNEGNSSAAFPGEPALLGPPVTQASPATPLIVAATALCAEAMGDPAAMAANTFTTPVNLFALPLNMVGSIMVSSNYNISAPINVSVGTQAQFNVSSTAGMGNNTYSVSVFPPYLGSVTNNGNGSFTINWQNTGAGSITFTGTNNCSGAQNSTSVSVTVGQ